MESQSLGRFPPQWMQLQTFSMLLWMSKPFVPLLLGNNNASSLKYFIYGLTLFQRECFWLCPFQPWSLGDCVALSMRNLLTNHPLQKRICFIRKQWITPTEFSVRVYAGIYGPVTAALAVGIFKQAWIYMRLLPWSSSLIQEVHVNTCKQHYSLCFYRKLFIPYQNNSNFNGCISSSLQNNIMRHNYKNT